MDISYCSPRWRRSCTAEACINGLDHVPHSCILSLASAIRSAAVGSERVLERLPHTLVTSFQIINCLSLANLFKTICLYLQALATSPQSNFDKSFGVQTWLLCYRPISLHHCLCIQGADRLVFLIHTVADQRIIGTKD